VGTVAALIALQGWILEEADLRSAGTSSVLAWLRLMVDLRQMVAAP